MHDANTPTLTPTGAAAPPYTDEPRDREHLDFLTRMFTENVVPAQTAEDARKAWQLTCAATAERLPIPAATTFDGGPIRYTWNRGDLHLEAEFSGVGPVEWFFRNWKTNELWSAELPADEPPPPSLVRILDALVAASQTN